MNAFRPKHVFFLVSLLVITATDLMHAMERRATPPSRTAARRASLARVLDAGQRNAGRRGSNARDQQQLQDLLTDTLSALASYNEGFEEIDQLKEEKAELERLVALRDTEKENLAKKLGFWRRFTGLGIVAGAIWLGQKIYCWLCPLDQQCFTGVQTTVLDELHKEGDENKPDAPTDVVETEGQEAPSSALAA